MHLLRRADLERMEGRFSTAENAAAGKLSQFFNIFYNHKNVFQFHCRQPPNFNLPRLQPAAFFEERNFLMCRRAARPVI